MRERRSDRIELQTKTDILLLQEDGEDINNQKVNHGRYHEHILVLSYYSKPSRKKSSTETEELRSQEQFKIEVGLTKYISWGLIRAWKTPELQRHDWQEYLQDLGLNTNQKTPNIEGLTTDEKKNKNAKTRICHGAHAAFSCTILDSNIFKFGSELR